MSIGKCCLFPPTFLFLLIVLVLVRIMLFVPCSCSYSCYLSVSCSCYFYMFVSCSCSYYMLLLLLLSVSCTCSCSYDLFVLLLFCSFYLFGLLMRLTTRCLVPLCSLCAMPPFRDDGHHERPGHLRGDDSILNCCLFFTLGIKTPRKVILLPPTLLRQVIFLPPNTSNQRRQETCNERIN